MISTYELGAAILGNLHLPPLNHGMKMSPSKAFFLKRETLYVIYLTL
jgi:hypothetical protein